MRGLGLSGAPPAQGQCLVELRGAVWGGCSGEVSIMGNTSANAPHAVFFLEVFQLGPIKSRRDEGHPTTRRQDRLKPGIPFPWKLRTKAELPHRCPSSSFIPYSAPGVKLGCSGQVKVVPHPLRCGY